jgi:hypothetical protein
VTEGAKVLNGFGITGRKDARSFSWEWFHKPNALVFEKLQERGSVRVKMGGANKDQIAEVEFLSDVSLRIQDSLSLDRKESHRINIKKGSVLSILPLPK